MHIVLCCQHLKWCFIIAKTLILSKKREATWFFRHTCTETKRDLRAACNFLFLHKLLEAVRLSITGFISPCTKQTIQCDPTFAKTQNYYYYLFFLAFYGFIDSTAEDMTGNRERERGSDTQQRDPGRESNPGLLQSLSTWDARSTHWAKRRPPRHRIIMSSTFKHLNFSDRENTTFKFKHPYEPYPLLALRRNIKIPPFPVYTFYTDGFGSQVEPASCYQKVAGLISLICMSKCHWARSWSPNCSWCAGRDLAWQLAHDCM